MNNSSFFFNRVLFALLMFLLGFSIAFYFAKKQSARSNAYSKLNDLIYYIDHHYVDSVNHELLSEEAIRGILENLDPHSVYSTAEENRIQTEFLEGAFEGIGVQFNIINDTIMVVASIVGGPSEKMGVKAGDRIVLVNDEHVAAIGITNEQVFKLLRGKKGTLVKVGVLRPEIRSIIDFDIIRDVIPTHSISAAYMIDQTIGYLRLDQFGSHTTYEFEMELRKLLSKGMKKMILDLRGNEGGYLDAALKITDHFLEKGERILSVKGLHSKSESFSASGEGLYKESELVVLIDEFSASSSEIVAGAIQDNDRGIIMGRRSFGKGLVQRPFNFSDSSQVRLTVSRYYTPSGRCIQRDYKNGRDAYYKDFMNRFMEEKDSTSYQNDTLSTEGYRTKLGRMVYGGGGITPDINIPHEKRTHTDIFYQLLNNTVLIQFTFQYTNQHKAILTKKYPSAESFIKNMHVSDAVLEEYLIFFAQKKSEQKPILAHAASTELKIWLKAFIGRNLFQDEAFYPVINTMDNVIQCAHSFLYSSD